MSKMRVVVCFTGWFVAYSLVGYIIHNHYETQIQLVRCTISQTVDSQ